MQRISRLDGWDGYGLENPKAWAGVRRKVSLASVLQEEDHIATVKHFFVESIHQLKEELTACKKEHPELPWKGGG